MARGPARGRGPRRGRSPGSRSPAAQQAGGRRMRGAGRGVVNGAFCLQEFGAVGGGAEEEGWGRRGRGRGPVRWAVRGSGGGGRGRRVLGPRGL